MGRLLFLFLFTASCASLVGAVKVGEKRLGPEAQTDTTLVRKYLNEAWALTDSAEYASALELYRSTAELAADERQWKNHIEALRGIGINLSRLGKQKEALEARKILVAASYKNLAIEEENISISENELAISYGNLGNYDSAFLHFKKALTHKLKYLGEFEPSTANTLNSMGSNYSRLEMLDSAVKYHSWALKIRMNLKERNDYSIGISQNNLGATYYKLGYYEKQAYYLREALTSFKKSRGENHPVLAIIYNNLANAYKMSGDYTNELLYMEKALGIRLTNFDEDHFYIAESYSSLASYYLERNKDFDKFFDLVNRALAINLKTYPNGHHKIASNYHSIGKGYEHQRQYSKAFSYYEKSLKLYHELFGEGHLRTATELAGMAACHSALGSKQEAIDLLQKAVEIRRKYYGDKHPRIALLYQQIARNRLDLEQESEALENLQKGIVSLSWDFNDSSILANPPLVNISSRLQLMELLEEKATIFEKQYLESNQPDIGAASLATYKLAADLADQIRVEIHSEESRERVTQVAAPVYNGVLNVAWNLYEATMNEKYLETMWEYSEKSKVFQLRLAQKKLSLTQLQGVPDSLIQTLKNLNTEILAKKEVVSKSLRKKDTLQIKRSKDQLFKTELRYRNLLADIEKDHQDYYKLMHDVSVLPIQQIQNGFLGNEKGLISYSLTDEKIYVFAVSKEKFQVYSLEKPKELGLKLAEYRKAVTDYQFITSHPTQADSLYKASAYFLYSVLLNEALSEMPATINEVIIVPDGDLGKINMESLLTKEVTAATQSDYRNMPYLINELVISYAYSATFSNHESSKKKDPSIDFGGFAPSYQAESIAGDTTRKMLAQLVRSGELNLPGALEEVETISQLFRSQTWVGEQATEQNFVQSASKYQVIHLAMHGLLDDADPLNSELVFAASTDSTYDGHLSVREIYNINLNADLVVLSACNSGYGEVRKGEGVISLSRAFQYAGCPSVITSLWKVSDEATKSLMIQVYDALAANETRGGALRKAKLTYIDAVEDPFRAHPYYWSGFILMGDSDEIEFKKNTTVWIVLAFATFLAISFGRKRLLQKRK